MRSGLIRGLAVSAALSLTSGCMFVQMTDHAFIGSPNDPPTHHERQWIGAVVLPLAVVGDIITAPGQVIALMIVGDFGIYARPNERVGSIGAADLRVASVGADGNLAEIALSDEQRSILAERLRDGSFEVSSAPRLAVR